MHFANHELFPCACCGYRVHRYPPGHHEKCPICGWEDDLTQLRFVEMVGAANHVSLREAQQNFSTCGAAIQRNSSEARTPESSERRDESWRPVDPKHDNIEHPARGMDYENSYPLDTTVLYYWRATYWRRVVS